MDQARLWPIYSTGNAGYIDRQGAVVVSGLRASHGFSEGLGAAQEAKAWGYVDVTGGFVLSGLARADAFEDGVAVAGKKGLGVIRRDGSWLVEPIYSRIDRLADGFRVTLRDKIGFVSRSGEMLTPPRFVDARGSSPWMAVRDDRWHLIDVRTGRIVDLEVEQVGSTGPDSASARVGEKWGIVGIGGEWLVKPTFGYAEAFDGDRAIVRGAIGQFGVIDRGGVVVVPLQHRVVRTSTTGYWIEDPDCGWLTDRDGKRVSGPWKERHVATGVDLVHGDEGWGVVRDGKLVIPAVWAGLHAVGRGRFAAQDPATQRWCVLDADGSIVIPARYRDIGLYAGDLVSTDDGRAWVADSGEVWRRAPPREPDVPVYKRPTADWCAAKARLAALVEQPRAVFGATGRNGHGYKIGPVRSEKELGALEAEHGIALPAELRLFLRTIGDGGAGPGYGLYPIADALRDAFPGLRSPFVPPDMEVEDERHGYEVPGLLVLGTEGCAFDYAVAVSGKWAGSMWVFTGDVWIPDTPAFKAVLEAMEDDYVHTYRWILANLDTVPIRTFNDAWIDWLERCEATQVE